MSINKHAPAAEGSRGATRKPTICVFCGSSFGNDPAYTQAAQRFGTLMVKNGFDLVFGGGGVGLMGVVTSAVSAAGGKILGVIPHFLRHLEPPLDVVSEIVVTEDMNERKARMVAAADGFAVLPGGLGTLDELAEVFTGAQLAVHQKPIVLLSIKNYFAPFDTLIDHMIAHGFANARVKTHYHVVDTPEAAIASFVQKICTQTSSGA